MCIYDLCCEVFGEIKKEKTHFQLTYDSWEDILEINALIALFDPTFNQYPIQLLPLLRKLYFHLFNVCWFVSRIAQKLQNKSPRNLNGGWVPAQNLQPMTCWFGSGQRDGSRNLSSLSSKSRDRALFDILLHLSGVLDSTSK